VENRKLSKEDLNQIQQLLKLGANKKLIAEKWKKKGKFISLKDLHNIQQRLKEIQDDDLSTIERLLQEKYGKQYINPLNLLVNAII